MEERTLRILLEHNAWATGRMLEVCSSLPEEQFHQSFEMGMGSLHGTLVHIIGAMRRWSDRIAGRPLRPSPQTPGKRWSSAELRSMLEEARQSLDEVAGEVCSSGALELPMTFEYEGTAHRFTKGAALVHVTTHGMHHRAQALNMLRQLGVNDLLDGIDVLDWAIAHEGPGSAQ